MSVYIADAEYTYRGYSLILRPPLNYKYSYILSNLLDKGVLIYLSKFTNFYYKPLFSSGLSALWRFASRLIQRTPGTQLYEFSNGDGHAKVNTVLDVVVSGGLPAPLRLASPLWRVD